LIEPFIAWGVPTLKTISDLIHKRGYAAVTPDYKTSATYTPLSFTSRNDRYDYDKKLQTLNVKLTDNSIIERHLGAHDIICIEDLVHEIHTVGSCFDMVNKFLAPFLLVADNVNGMGQTKFNMYMARQHKATSEERDTLINDYIKQFL